MESLLKFFPTADELLAESPDDLAPILLRLAARAGPMFWPDAVAEIKQGTGMATSIEFAYPYHKKAQVTALLGEAWEKLRRDGFIMPAADQNGRNGYMVLTRDARVFHRRKTSSFFMPHALSQNRCCIHQLPIRSTHI